MTEEKPPQDNDVRARLHRTLIDEVDGKRTCVLVLGDGLNRQAKHQQPDCPSDWQCVLSTIWSEAGGAAHDFAPEDQSASTAWAMIIAQWADYHGGSVKSADHEVRQRICALFAPIEAGVQRHLYAKVLGGNLANVITFSVDRCLQLQSGARSVALPPAKASILQRHFEVTGVRGMTRVWVPYGDTSDVAAIDPGHSAFDTRLMELESARASLMDANNAHDFGYGPGLRPPIFIYPRCWHAPETWCELFLCAPLVIVGASLPADDWPLWWLLHQRMRYFVPFKDWEVAETLYLTSRPGDNPHVLNGAAGIETVQFAHDDELWHFVLSALDGPGVDLHAGWNRRFGP